MIKKTSSFVFQEATGIRILVQELEKNRRIKAYFSENDKTPNTDGYFEILRDDGLPLKRFVVQIKSVTGENTLYNLSAGGYAYRSDSAFFQYIQNDIDSNPAMFFVIDVKNKRIFYKHLSSEFLRELNLRYLQNRSLSKQDQKKVTIHFNEDDILNEERFYNVCLEVCKDVVSVQMSIDQNTRNSGEAALDIRELQQSFENEEGFGSIDHNPKVFLSYSWAGDIYQARVLKIATWLVEHGVDVILDQWHLKYGQDMDVFMEMSIRNAEKVLILCESTYKTKADQQIDRVGRETLIITPEIYREYNQEKFIPVVMETPIAIPSYLQARKAVFLTEETEEGLRELLRAIFDITEKRPSVGKIPSVEWLRSRVSKKESVTYENKTVDTVSDIKTLAQPKIGRIPDWIREGATEHNKKVGEDKSKGREALSAINVSARLIQSTLRKNETVPFGRYSQRKVDEKETLLWRVLAVDLQENRALIICEKLIDCRQYYDKATDITWEGSDLRRWLNQEFFNNAFNDEERERIALTCNQNPNNRRYGTVGGNMTQDRVFLLSLDEAKAYFCDNKDRRASITPYAKKQGSYYAKNDMSLGKEPLGWWWLRSPGYDGGGASCVSPEGCVMDDGYNVYSLFVSVRPALWMNF